MNRPRIEDFGYEWNDYAIALEEYATHLEQQIKTVQQSLLDELYYSRKLSQQDYFEEKRKLK